MQGLSAAAGAATAMCLAALTASPATAADFRLLDPTPQASMWEVRGGLFAHSPGFRESGSLDINAELLSPRLGVPIDTRFAFLIPRLQAGAFLNTGAKTSYVYGGFAWELDITSRIFLEPMFGVAYHNGKLDTDDADRVSLGCNPLFHTGLSVGFRATAQWSVVGTWDHISNAGLCGRNVGLNTYGLKVGYSF